MPVDAKKNVAAWLPAVGYCVILFVQSSFASPKLLPTFPGMDKLLHFGAYGVLGLLFMRAFRITTSRIGVPQIMLYSLLLTTAYGISDEVHQSFVIARTADVMDALADALGGGCGIFLYYMTNRNVYATGRQNNRQL
jgi:VanZ family protein